MLERIYDVVLVSDVQQSESVIHISNWIEISVLHSRSLLVTYFIYSSVKWSEMNITQLCQNLCKPMDYTDHGILQARIPEWVPPSPWDLPNPGMEPTSPSLQADSLAAEPSGKPYLIVYMCQFQSSNLFLPTLSPDNHQLVFQVCNSISGL